MVTDDRATIYAPASALGRAGVTVIRVSGPNARQTFNLTPKRDIPRARQAVLRRLLHPRDGELLDRALMIFFEAPHSFTGEDVVEIHAHGGHAVLKSMLDALHSLPGFRFAEPGEFSRRAFEHGRLDLTEAEAIADLVNAETRVQQKQALRQMEGELGRLYEGWRVDLTRVLAYSEAVIDFVDEDLPDDVLERRNTDIAHLIKALERHLDDNHRGERVREGLSLAIVGAPNAGKSSLLNYVARRDVAIVSATAGTTRDIIDVHLELGGYPVVIADTAGLRATDDLIEQEGVGRALRRAGHADLKLLIFDGANWPRRDPATTALSDEKAIIVVNKSDLIAPASEDGTAFFVSAKTGAGVDRLLDHVAQRLQKEMATGVTPPLTRQRHRDALEACRTHLERAMGTSELELRAEDLRLALRELGRITGRVDVEDLLDVIFRDFCIGK